MPSNKRLADILFAYVREMSPQEIQALQALLRRELPGFIDNLARRAKSKNLDQQKGDPKTDGPSGS